MLSKRLNVVLNLLESDKVLADIGCDHALLPIEIVRLKKVPKAYAIDNKKEPLKQAELNIKKAGLEEKVITLLADGIKSLPSDVKQISIAGLGGGLIADIIDDKHIEQLDCLVLEGNSDAIKIRKKLEEKNYRIIDEELVEENGLIYETIKAVKGQEKLDYRDCYFGPILRKKKGELFFAKWQRHCDYLTTVLAKIPFEYADKRGKIEEEIALIKEEIKDGI